MNAPARVAVTPPPLIGYVLAAAGAIMFASKGVLIKIAYDGGLDAVTLLALRMLFSAPVFILVGFLSARRKGAVARSGALTVQTFLAAAGTGLLGYWFASFTDFKGLETLSPQFERLILFTYPLFVVLFGAALFGHPLRLRSVAAFGIAYLGLAVVFLADFADEGSSIIVGTAWVMSSAVAFALYQLCAKPMIGKLGAPVFTAVGMSGASAGVLVHFALTHPLSALWVSADDLRAALMVAVLATVFPTYLMNAALTMISAAANATIGTLSPVFTLILAALVLGETISASDVAGTLLVLTGVGLFTLIDRKG